ncbi:ABC transporter ATP-binding protein [Metabacillus fastidiosus]|uniref:ABC transporter ATP-binding protein n=2 Tax=Metabacillus fastidiosus TaxID=1458 RepID=A0ABU6P2M9_9BACI|nr:ABC transporter ATP-binding protein [Metabacillus fastidiosus]MED4403611.1 ABC transporter ATP-binding protein [Metabacillus fastidiosus]MED4463662.1 ABC transporter ATP-binding protein [Metabacillus fastidiosus]
MSYLNIHNLTVNYPFQRKSVLKGVDLQINKGEKLLILGPSGGGKSTLALTLNGIIPRSIEAEMTGTITIDSHSPSELNFREISERIGMLFQDPETQFCMLTVEDEIIFGLENLRLSKSEIKVRMEQSLELVGLSNYKKAQIKELSGGMKQKLGLACLLAMEPEVFILDEPTANLDPESTEEIFELLITLSKKLNKTLIFIEHKLDSLLPYLKRVIVLGNDGSVLADGPPKTVFKDHYTAIAEQGIWVPEICKYAKEAEKEGLLWNEFPLTIDEFTDGLKGKTFDVQLNENYKQHHSETILRADHLSFSYNDKQVLKDINFSISQGDFVAILGPNGAGKSTMSQLFIKLLKPKQGDIYLKNEPISKLKTSELMQKLGYVFQNPEHQFICDTVEQELAYGLKMLGWEKEKWLPRVNELLEQFHLTDRRENNPFSLSQGQKRRLSVATMLTNDQQILILDEPTFGQDYINTKGLMTLLKNLNDSGKTIIMITHDMELVLNYANKVILINKNEVQYEGDVIPFFQNESLLRTSSITLPISYQLIKRMNANEEATVLC